ncbi:MAG: substrate-binding domain-containing protein [Bdellovibrionales bacterium]|nr:substrate-binding domain-containing protein [Bdellovibrionales bacterium]
MRQRIISCALLIVCAALTVAPSASARDRIQIVGSSTVYPFATVVAERLGKKPNMKTPVIESTGTGGGMKLFCAGVGEQYPDITNASRKMKASEWEMCRNNGVTEIVEVTVGNDGIAFANSRQGKHYNFSKEQLWTALAAKGPKPELWSQIDKSLPATKIKVLVPPPTSGTRDAWNALVMAEGCSASVKSANKEECELLREDGAVIEAGENDALIVQKLSADPSAFGIFGFSYLDQNRDKIQAAAINGVEISLPAIQDYSYPIARPLFFYVKKAHIGVIPGIREYINEFTSSSAMGDEGYLADVGLVPLHASEFNKVRAIAQALTPMENVS